jgi:iron complex outermembrane receptor protein
MIFALTCLVVSSAYAQSIEEIVVTARKKEESLQDVPLSVSAYSAEQLQAQGIRNNYQLADFTVNFNTMQQLGRRDDRPVIRGQTASAQRGEPNASYFIDGVFVSGSISTAMLGVVERVEVLRGPQSAQFGRSTFSGAVNYVTRQPSNSFEGEFTSKAGSNEDYQLGGWVSGPIVEDKLMFLVGANWESFGGEWNNALLPDSAPDSQFYINPPQQGDTSSLGGTETKEINGKLLFTPTGDSAFTVKYSYSEGDDDHYAPIQWTELNCYLPESPSQPWWDSSAAYGRAGAFCGEMGPGGLSSRINLPDARAGMQTTGNILGVGTYPEDYTALPAKPGTRREQRRFLFQFDQGLGDWDMIQRFAYNTDALDQVFDLDRMESRGLPLLTNLFLFQSDKRVDDWSFEMRFASPQDGPVRGQFGVYYFESDTSGSQRSFPGPGLAQFTNPRSVETFNTAIFGTIEMDLAEDLSLAFETRYAEDSKDLKAPIYDPATDVNNVNLLESSLTFNSFTPRVTLRYQHSDEVMMYGLVAKGNKPGGFNIGYFAGAALPTAFPNDPISEPDDPRCNDLGVALGAYDAIACGNAFYKEEQAWTYEAGVKTSWMDRRITANLSLFYIDWDDQGQFQTVDTARNGGNVTDTKIINSGQSRSIGLELETNFAATDNLFLVANYGYVHAEYIKFNSDFYAGLTGINDPDGDGNVAGNRLQNNPEHSFVLGVVYTDQLTASLGWFGRTDLSYETAREVNETNLSQMGDRTLLNVRLGVESEAWRLTFYITNLLDDDTPTAISDFLNFLPDTSFANGANANIWTMNPNRGRNYGLEMSYRFGS